jgi:hypothetical protein
MILQKIYYSVWGWVKILMISSILKIVMLINMDLYLESVQTYKRELKNWQAGSKVDVAMICLILVPLMDKALEEPGNILMLHHYCRRLCIPSCHFNWIDRGDILLLNEMQ